MRHARIAALALLLLAACGAPQAAPGAPQAGEILVFAAASLTDAFTEVGAAFEAATPGARVTFNFAGSQQLAAQIGEGAPADLFASASGGPMETAIASGRISGGAPQIFARNRLVLITPRDNPAGIGALADLARPGVRLVLADRAVPAGQYSQQVIERAGALPEYGAAYRAAVAANVVSFEENVRAVLTKVALGEADAGIVYATDAALEAAQVRQVAIPDALNVIASYPIALAADSARPELAAAFIAFVRSPDGQRILAKYGFLSPTP